MRLVVLDRDGVINRESDHYIRSPQEWKPLPGSLEAVARLCRADYRVAVATNQSGIGRGLYDVETLNRIHQHMLDALRRKGGNIDAIAFCPHTPSDNCACRKPKPGLLLALGRRLKMKMQAAIVVGDSLRDLQAARAVGATPVLVLSGKNEFQLAAGDTIPDPDFSDVAVFDSLADFVDYLLTAETKH